MEKGKPHKRAPVKIGEWPWWLKPPYSAWGVMALMAGLWMVTLVFGRRRLPWWEVIILMAITGVSIGLGYVIVRWFFKPWADMTRRKEEGMPKPICPKCGYDVRGTLLRCPECGADTPFKLWLDKQHPLERYMFKRHLAKHPHRAESGEEEENRK